VIASKTESICASVEALDPKQIFGRMAPLHVDLGCGDGSFLLQMAELHPDKNFLGIERLAQRVSKAGRKANSVENVRVLRLQTEYVVEFLLPPQSAETFYLLFPDPWPKRRHHRRRIFTTHFLHAIHEALEPGGILHVATDDLDYFQHIERVALAAANESARKVDCFKRSTGRGFRIAESEGWQLPETKFERKFRAAGLAIYRLSLRKISPVTEDRAVQPPSVKPIWTAPV
jgi:tRNA (guanine-N7-)-methyltransferase